jgi:hypothetical protein
MDHDDELRALWREQKSKEPLMSTQEVMRLDSKFSRRVGARNVTEYATAALLAVYFGSVAVIPGHTGAVSRVGAAMIVGAALHAVVELRRRGTALPPPAVDAPTQVYVEHHRAQLTRQRDLLATAPRWYVAPFVAGTLVYVAGIAIDVLGRGAPMGVVGLTLAGVLAVLTAVFVGVLFLNRHVTKRLSKKIDALDE